MKKTFLLLVFLLLFACVTSAKLEDPVTQISSGGLTIIYPKFEYVSILEDFSINILVFNSTNYLKNDTDTNCTLHIYDQTGNLLLNKRMMLNGENHNFSINNTLIKTEGIYPLSIWCEAVGGQAGFVSTELFVLHDKSVMYSDFGNDSFLIISLTFLILTGGIILAIFTAKKLWIKSVLCFLLWLFIVTILRFTSWFLSKTNPEMTHIISLLDRFYGWSINALYIIIPLLLFMLIILIINNAGKKKENDFKPIWE